MSHQAHQITYFRPMSTDGWERRDDQVLVLRDAQGNIRFKDYTGIMSVVTIVGDDGIGAEFDADDSWSRDTFEELVRRFNAARLYQDWTPIEEELKALYHVDWIVWNMRKEFPTDDWLPVQRRPYYGNCPQCFRAMQIGSMCQDCTGSRGEHPRALIFLTHQSSQSDDDRDGWQYAINPMLIHKVIHKGTVKFDEPTDTAVWPIHHDVQMHPMLPRALIEELSYLQVDMLLEYPFYEMLEDHQGDI